MKRCMSFLLAIVFVFVLTGGAGTQEKPWTLLIYMNGSDLESEWGAATDDLVEMLDSGLCARNANVVILTGGTVRWMNDALPAGECVVWELVDGHLYEVVSFGDVNMGDRETLRDFIALGLREFPARRTGLILWDHGGGSVAGFGDDERFADGSLTLADMAWAFEAAGLRQRPLALLGFDACLMATVEMAVVAAPFAQVLVASEDTEPGDGWDYGFLEVFNFAPCIDGALLGKVIVDTFMDFYGENSDEILTLSVVDLARVQGVMDAMGRLMAAAGDKLAYDCHAHRGFYRLAQRRAATKTFGEGSPRDNYADMVDIGDMAVQLADLFPREAAAVLRALADCVLYNRHNAEVALHGLSTFYIYGGRSEGAASLRTYKNLGMDADFTRYLHDFFDALMCDTRAETLREVAALRNELALWKPMTEDVFHLAGLAQDVHSPSDALRWPHIYGHMVSFFPAGGNQKGPHYAVPVRVNGRDADLMVSTCTSTHSTRVMGIRQRDGHVKQKGYDPIRAGDIMAFYTLEWNVLTDATRWKQGRPFTVRGPLQVEWAATPQGYVLTDGLPPSNYASADYFPAHQRSAFSSVNWYCGLCQTASVCPGVSTHTRPLPRASVYPAAHTAATALKYGSLSTFAISPCAAA